MKTYLTFIILFLAFQTSCTSDFKETNKELIIPDKVVVKHSETDIQFSGTSVFIVNPEGYKHMPSLMRIYKNDDTHIQCAELPGNFIKQKSSIRQGIEGLKSKGFKLYFEKEFQLGEFAALIIYGSNSKPNSDQIFLIYGDTISTVMLTGIFNSDDEKSKNEIFASMLTSYFDKTKKPDYSELTNFSIDLSQTEYKLNSNVSMIFIYTINGEGDLNKNPFVNQIMIYSFPPMKSFDILKDHAKSFVKNVSDNGVKISNTEETVIKINGLDTYLMTFDGVNHDKIVKAYLTVFGDEKSSILFCGTAYTDFDKTIDTFKNIANTLRTKELK